jgi:hypothetical protein
MKSLFKGAGANILRGVAGAGVLSLYDKLQQVMFGKVYSGGKSLAVVARITSMNTTKKAPAENLAKWLSSTHRISFYLIPVISYSQFVIIECAHALSLLEHFFALSGMFEIERKDLIAFPLLRYST